MEEVAHAMDVHDSNAARVIELFEALTLTLTRTLTLTLILTLTLTR